MCFFHMCYYVFLCCIWSHKVRKVQIKIPRSGVSPTVFPLANAFAQWALPNPIIPKRLLGGGAELHRPSNQSYLEYNDFRCCIINL